MSTSRVWRTRFEKRGPMATYSSSLHTTRGHCDNQAESTECLCLGKDANLFLIDPEARAVHQKAQLLVTAHKAGRAIGVIGGGRIYGLRQQVASLRAIADRHRQRTQC
jgi:hypothetical protein